MHAVHGGGSSLVELARDVFNCQVFLSKEVQIIRNGIRDRLAEHAVTAFLQKAVGESEEVVHIDEPEALQFYGQVFGQLGTQALRLNAERFLFLYE